MLQEFTERQLISRIVRGDRQAKEEFVQQYSLLIRTVTRRTGLSEQDTADVYQQVFVLLWEDNCRRLRQWQGSGKLSSYLSVIAMREAQDFYRRKMRRDQPEEDIETTTQSGPERELFQIVYRRQQQQAINSTLQRLTPRDAELITRKHWHGDSYREIAEALDITVNHVGVALSRAEQRLQNRLIQGFPGLFEVALQRTQDQKTLTQRAS